MNVEWRDDISSEEWDAMLTLLNGHPLQSSSWGNARAVVDGIKDQRWAAFQNGRPVYLIRFEERKFLGLVKVAWAPRGPIMLDVNTEACLQKALFKRLKQKKFSFFITHSWQQINPIESSSSHTMWIDLTLGQEKLWSNLDKQFRYDVRRANKEGVIVEVTQKCEDINTFYDLCYSVANKKKFHLNTSNKLMSHLVDNGNNTNVKSYLFAARYQGKICAGAFIIHCGNNVHYMWGAADREFSKQRVGEAVQWAVIEWALKQNCKLYDLEGINLKEENGVYQFKKKLGGKVIALSEQKIYPLNRYVRMMMELKSINKVMQFLAKISQKS